MGTVGLPILITSAGIPKQAFFQGFFRISTRGLENNNGTWRCNQPLFKQTTPTEQAKIGVHEAYTIWRSLIDRYVFIDHFNQLKNYTHDQDFLKYLKQIIKDFKEETSKLEEVCRVYSIPSPDPSIRDKHTTGNSEIVADRDTAEVVYRFLRVDLNILLLGLKSSYINDTIKKFLIHLTKKAIQRVDKYVKYIKSRNWVETPPLYPFVPPEIPEKVAINEVHLLFDHLTFRYNNIHQTSLFSNLASDKEFQLLLEVGTKILEKQIKDLEEKLLYFGINLPKPYPINVPVPASKEMLKDRFMYNIVFRGIQDAMVLHGTAISEVIVNDKLRKMFIDLTFEELSMMDKIDKYGKIKGWVFQVPTFKGDF
jgi:hypothetical protein